MVKWKWLLRFAVPPPPPRWVHCTSLGLGDRVSVLFLDLSYMQVFCILETLTKTLQGPDSSLCFQGGRLPSGRWSPTYLELHSRCLHLLQGGGAGLHGCHLSQTAGGAPGCRVPQCHQSCLLCPPRSTPTRDTASAALSLASTMKSRCCTFYKNTSEGLQRAGRTLEHKWLHYRHCQHHQRDQAGRTQWPCRLP